MKFRTTQKAVKENYSKIVCIGYGNAQALLRYRDPIAYNAGVQWNFDLYDVGGIAITTGYSPIGKIKPDYDLIRVYEDRADAVNGNYDLSYTQKQERVDAILQEFLTAICS